MPRASPTKSTTRMTPSATPIMLMAVRSGRWRMLATIRLSMLASAVVGVFGLDRLARRRRGSVLRLQVLARRVEVHFFEVLVVVKREGRRRQLDVGFDGIL